MWSGFYSVGAGVLGLISGWLITYLIMKGKIDTLEESLENLEDTIQALKNNIPTSQVDRYQKDEDGP